MQGTITAAQHIFASLTREQSLGRRRGYQTLFYTRERLTKEDVRAIEDRAQYRITQGGNDKWQFHRLPSQQAVITHFVPVPEPDEFGRKGRYLAHSIILHPDQWRSVESNPFDLMMAGNFCRTMDQALSLGDLKTGAMGTAPLEISPARRERAMEVAKQWSPDELGKLIQLTCHPRGTKQAGQFVAFVGDDRQINEALALAFLLPPPNVRTECSFDTASSGCSWPKEITFWARGFADEREARTPFVVYAGQRKVKLPPEWRPPVTPYESWQMAALRSGGFWASQKDQRGAQLLSAALEGSPVGQTEIRNISSTFKSAFAAANQAQVEQAVARLLPDKIPSYLRDLLIAKIGRTPQAQLDWVLRDPSGEQLAVILFEIAAKWQDAPADEVLRALQPLIARHSGLQLLLALWSNDQKEAQRRLSLMTADEYEVFVPTLFCPGSREVWHFFSARHLRGWFAVFQGLTFHHVSQGISLVAKYGTDQELDGLAALTSVLDVSTQQELLTWLKEQGFRKKVKLLISALEQNLRTKSQSASDNSRGWFR